ncbi:ankyrin repeat and SOCS box protein 2-like [Trichomycterus rosablanca]|uniref:ankyrin repeat and SOCS box protein 2-like n=1 Tax=Trichomycterus rosablanca TaxID=2290929 RepID=UPI002F35BC91
MTTTYVSEPGRNTSAVDAEDYSAYANMSEEQLIQLAIERSLADTNPTLHQSCQRRSPAHSPAQPTRLQRPRVSPSANSPANPPPSLSANPPRNQSTDSPRDAQSHYFSKEKNQVIAWTRHNGHLRVTVESIEDLDPLFSAVWKGDAKALGEVIKSKSRNITQANQEGWIPLHEAAYYGQVECLKILLKADPDTINRRTLKNQTPLILAVGRRHTACVRYLLEKGADPNLANNQWETPLYKACEKGGEEVVGLLIRYGASTTKSSVQGATPLHEAVMNKNLEICKMLVQAGAQLMKRNMYGIDPLFTAAQCGTAEILSFLLMKGAEVNTQANDGASALLEACKNGHGEVVEMMLSRGADVNKCNKAGLLPIHLAAKNGHDGIVAMLIPKTSRAKIRSCGISPLHLAAEQNRDDVLETLIESCFDVNAMLSEDWSNMYEDHRKTALYSAVANSNLEAATMLLEAGANQNLDTFNPLLVAVRKGCMEMVKLLVEHGADVNAVLPTHPTNFPAALIFCINYLPLFKFLMDSGCDAMSCFKCDYGSNPHPPIKSSANWREGIYCISDENAQEWVQFCEMISGLSASCWVGPVVDILLNYVGHVKLCSRLVDHLDSYSDWVHIKERAMLPCSLMQLCRLKIRQQLGVQRLRHLASLPLPKRLIKYLKHERESFKDILNS